MQFSGLTLFVKPTGPQLFQSFGLPLVVPDAGAEVPSAPRDSQGAPVPMVDVASWPEAAELRGAACRRLSEVHRSWRQHNRAGSP
jgi:hypothetical protein